jgi:hypothetical protein
MTNEEFIGIISGGKLEHTEKHGWLYRGEVHRYVSSWVAWRAVKRWIDNLPADAKERLQERVIADIRETCGRNWQAALRCFEETPHGFVLIEHYCKEILAMIESEEINPPTQPQPSYRHSAPDQQS